MLGGWKEFAFFDVTPVKDPSSQGRYLYSDPDLLDVSSGNETMFMSTRAGVVKEFTKDAELVTEFQACDPDWGRTPDFIRHVPNTNLLVTVAPKLGHPVELTVWDLTHSPPSVHSRALIANGTNTYPLAAFCMNDAISVLAFGFADGAVIIVRGDLLHDRGTRQRHVFTATTGVTGLAFTAAADKLFVSSLNQVVALATTSSKSVIVLEKAKGAELGCTSAMPDDEFLTARDTEVATYNVGHRGPSLELAIPKKRAYLTRNGHYLVLATVWGPTNRSLLSTESVRVVVVDLRNHLVAFNAHLANGIRAIIEQWGRINIIGSDGVLYFLTEKPLETRLTALTSQHLYQVAIKMASRELGSEKDPVISRLHRDFAEYQFEKNDVRGALKEYVEAISLGETSLAIRRFKDSQHVDVLLEYLNVLYERSMVTPQHVTLQIICYTKLGNVPELKAFLESATSMPDFDFEAAIGILLEAHDQEYSELAAFVAERWPDPDLVVQIRLRQLDDVQGCLDYIQTVSTADALRVLIQNSRTLLNKLPVETTAVLITLFTGKFVTRGPSTATSGPIENNAPVLQSYQAFIKYLSSTSYLGSHIVSAETLESTDSEPSYLPPRPRLIFPSFIGHENEFVIFLEACLHAAPSFHPPEKDLSDIATTLFEVYLSLGAVDRASQLIDDYSNVLHGVNVLSISTTFGFKLTPEQQVSMGSSYADVLRQAIDIGKFDNALSILEENANSDHDSVMQALRLLTSNKSALDYLRAESDRLTNLLGTCIEAGMSYVQLLGELSASPYLTVGDVKPFLIAFLRSKDDQVQRHEKLTASYQEEIKEKRLELEKLTSESLVFQYGKCSQCSQPLDLPAVHFACKHSYHERCVSSTSNCPICRTENETLETLRKQNAETAAKEEYFFDELAAKTDKLKVITDFIARGALSTTP